jgi:hypothetical protein
MRTWLAIGETKSEVDVAGFPVGECVAGADCSWFYSTFNDTDSMATTAWESSVRSPSWESPSSPRLWSSERVFRAYLRHLQHFLRGDVQFLDQLLWGRFATRTPKQSLLDPT